MLAEVRVEIAPGPLGLVFEPGSTVVRTVKPGSALSDCEPGDYIAAHSDDERQHRKGAPIVTFSLPGRK